MSRFRRTRGPGLRIYSGRAGTVFGFPSDSLRMSQVIVAIEDALVSKQRQRIFACLQRQRDWLAESVRLEDGND